MKYLIQISWDLAGLAFGTQKRWVSLPKPVSQFAGDRRTKLIVPAYKKPNAWIFLAADFIHAIELHKYKTSDKQLNKKGIQTR